MAYEKQTWETGQIITAVKLNHMEDGIDENNMAYEKQTWETGDVITAEKLNHMESGIEDGGGGGGGESDFSTATVSVHLSSDSVFASGYLPTLSEVNGGIILSSLYELEDVSVPLHNDLCFIIISASDETSPITVTADGDITVEEFLGSYHVTIEGDGTITIGGTVE